MLGHRAIYHDGWRAVCPWPGPSFTEAGVGFGQPISADKLTELDASGWELYHVAEDFAETTNVASEHRDKLIALIGHVVRRGREVRRPAGRRKWTRAPARREATRGRAPRPLRLRPEHPVDPLLRRPAGAQPTPQHHRERRAARRRRGGRAAQPGHCRGRVLTVRPGREAALRAQLRGPEPAQVSAPEPLPSGRARAALRVRAHRPAGPGQRAGRTGTLQLYVDGTLVAETRRRPSRRRSSSTRERSPAAPTPARR